jgi:hypothetical protein
MSENYLEKNKRRAFTRFKKESKKLHVLKKIVLNNYYHYEVLSSFEDQDNWFKDRQMDAAFLFQHPRKCSCNMCGNPRRKGWGSGLTLKEEVYKDNRHPDNKEVIKKDYY